MRDMSEKSKVNIWSEKLTRDPNKSVIYELRTRNIFFIILYHAFDNFLRIGQQNWHNESRAHLKKEAIHRLSRCKKIMMMLQLYWGDLPWFCIEGIFCRQLDYWPNRVKSDKGGYPAAVRTLSVPAEKKRKRIDLNCPLSIGFPRTCAPPFKVGRKNSGSGYNPPGPPRFSQIANKLHFSLYLPLFMGHLLHFRDLLQRFRFPAPELPIWPMWKRLVAGCENCWRLGRKLGDTSSDEPQTSIITWKMTQSTWSIAAEKMGTPVSSSNYQALWLKWRDSHHLNLLSFKWCKRFLLLYDF